MQVMARARSSSFVRLPVFLIVTLVFCEAWPSQALHGHGHGRIHRHSRDASLTSSFSPSSSAIITTSSEHLPSDEAIRKLADVAPHFDGFGREIEPVDNTSPITYNSDEVSTETILESPIGLDDLIVPRREVPCPAGPDHRICKSSEHALQPRVLLAPSSTSVNPSVPMSSICPSQDGKKYTSKDGKEYKIICNLNIVQNDLPFQLAESFEECVEKCDSWNIDNGKTECLAVEFVPDRLIGGTNDCYLKKSMNKTEPSTGLVEGAILSGQGVGPLPPAASTTGSNAARMMDLPRSNSQTSTVSQTFASASTVVVPQVGSSHLHGVAENRPTTQYFPQRPIMELTLAKSLLGVGVNTDLTVDYGLSPDTGCLRLDDTDKGVLQDLEDVPHLSRDGGKGGYLNGQHLFLFCDTGSYANTTQTSYGEFLGFVSSSVAIDVGMNGLEGKPLHIQDGVGEWSDDVGRMRGFSPLTSGELAYNLADQANGQRYAIWPEASFIPLDAESAVLFAPIVYDNVNRATNQATFTYTGTTLLTITVNDIGGPVAERTVARIFNENEVEWGCVAGIRSWGPSGVGGTDGKVYVFGEVDGGLLLARTEHDSVVDRDSYEYWTGTSWSSGMIPPSTGAYVVPGGFLDFDILYSPRHLTFIIVYLAKYADSTFYYRYLESDEPILPPYAQGGDPKSDYVELLTKYSWSSEQVLYKAQPGLNGKYAYSGGVHQGYYGEDDITNGGAKMLISWTAPTGQDPASINTEYQLLTAEVDWV